jgi:hypothetical protein
MNQIKKQQLISRIELDTYDHKRAEFLEDISGIAPEDIVYWW